MLKFIDGIAHGSGYRIVATIIEEISISISGRETLPMARRMAATIKLYRDRRSIALHRGRS
jgi:hypothetical protein